MKQFLLKTPPFLLFFLIFTPILLPFLEVPINLLSFEIIVVIRIFQSILLLLWMLSLVTYFNAEKIGFKYTKLTYLLIRLTHLVFFIGLLTNYLSNYYILMIEILLHISVTILLYKLIKRVFYARSKWFIFIELFFPFIGLLTLTTAAQEWENSDKT